MKKKLLILFSLIAIFILGIYLYKNIYATNLNQSKYLYSIPSHTGVGLNSTLKYGYMDKSGKELVSSKFISCEDYFDINSLGWFQNENMLYGFINSSGNIICEAKYIFATKFINDFALVVTSNNKNSYDFVKFELNNLKDIEKNKVPKDIQAQLLKQYNENYKTVNNNITYKTSDKLSSSGEYLKSLYINGKQTSDNIYTKIFIYKDFISVSDGSYTFFLDSKGNISTDYPKVKGNGILKIVNDLILFNIDNRYIYISKNGSTIWNERQESLKLDNVSVIEKKSDKSKYPEITLESKEISTLINNKIKTYFNEISENNYSTDFEIEKNKNLLIINKFTIKSTDNGTQVIKNDIYHFDIKDGKEYKLSDLFKSSINIKEILKSDNAELNNIDFKIQKECIEVIFSKGNLKNDTYVFKKKNYLYGDLEKEINTSSSFWSSFDKLNLTDEALKEKANNCIKNYIENFSSSVNSTDFKKIEPYILKDENPNSFYSIQKLLLYDYKTRRITEELTDYNICGILRGQTNTKEITYKAYADETYNIKIGEKSPYSKKFNWKYTLTYNIDDAKFYLSDILAWDNENEKLPPPVKSEKTEPNNKNTAEKEKNQNKSNGKVVYLTFDDGPNAQTPSILDSLKKYNYKATFFMLSDSMKTYKNTLLRMKTEGHELALHGSTHTFKEVYKDDYSVVNSMNKCNSVLESLVGQKSFVCRVPYGTCSGMKQSQLKNLRSAGYRVWDWDIDSEDSISNKVTSDHIYNVVTNSLKKASSESIVLMHDKVVTANALPRILEFLNSNNYVVKTIPSDMPGKSFLK